MRTKKLIAILSVLAVLACRLASPMPQTPETTAVPTKPPTAAPTREAGGLMCIMVPNVESPYFRAQQEITAWRAEELGYTVLKLVHSDDVKKQNEQIDACIAQQAVAIILNNAGADATVAAIQKAKDAGVPTFLIDREINREGVAVSQIMSNSYQGATLLAEEFGRLMGEEGEYIELTGRDTDTGSGPIQSKAFHEVLDQYPDIKLVAQQTANWNQTEAFAVMERLLPAHPNVKGVICGNVSMALGAQAALKAAGKNDVIVAGFGNSRGIDFDGSDDLTRSILNGEIDAGALQPVAKLAMQAVIQADRYIRTGATGMREKQSIDMILLTPKNACVYTAFAPNGKASCP